MKIKWTIWALFLGLLGTTPILAQNEEKVLNNDEMVEFCAASLIVVRRLPEYEKWLTRYEPNLMLVKEFQMKLEILIAAGSTKGSEILEVADECLEASAQEIAESGEERT